MMPNDDDVMDIMQTRAPRTAFPRSIIHGHLVRIDSILSLWIPDKEANDDIGGGYDDDITAAPDFNNYDNDII